MSVNPFIELSNIGKGMYQLVGTPNSNYNKLLYGKSLLACHEGRAIFFIDNCGVIEKASLIKDLREDTNLLSEFFIFSPTSQLELFETIDDLDLLYLQQNKDPTIFISNIFQFSLLNPRNTKNNELLFLNLGFLKTFSEKYNIPVFVSNETRKIKSKKYPFLSYALPPFFDKIFMVDYVKGEQIIFEYQM